MFVSQANLQYNLLKSDDHLRVIFTKIIINLIYILELYKPAMLEM